MTGKGTDLAIGVMSGTSVDGVNAVLASLEWTDAPRPRVSIRAHQHVPFTKDLRERIFRAVTGDANVPELALLHADLGTLYAEVVEAMIREHGRAAVVGLHGQTVAHLPASGVTLQIGDAARVAVRTGVPVVSDLRSADIAAGGEGAPLTPFADHVLFAGDTSRVVLNLGGIANLTLLPDEDPDHVRGFDTGPGNMVLDTIARMDGSAFDRDGVGARRGRVTEGALTAALSHPFFARRAPKSTGREEFGEPFARELERDVRERGGSRDDALATATELTARTVADALRAETPDGVRWREVLVGGGGAENGALMDALRRALAPIAVHPTDDVGIPAGAREALAFAILAVYRMRGLPNTLPRCTGASRAVSAGAIHDP